MSRRDVRPDIRPERNELMPPPSKCAKFLYYTWRLCSMVFSHFVMISLVVAYCILGAVTFEKLEAQHEREVKQNVSRLRHNATHYIWNLAREPGVFKEDNWTRDVIDMLKDFEGAILLEMKVRGWDGSESLDHVQWTFTGALFYSIIVITTIGYGHIVPKTQTGKVVTIFYAILGIPLMLLCLSNIGDVMASSFRFLYWRVCCYVCTRPPKRRHRHHTSSRRSVRAGSARGSTRRRRPPMERAHSDTDCRYRDSGYGSARTRRSKQSLAAPRTRSQPPHSRVPAMREHDREDRSPARHDRERVDRDCDQEDVDFPKISLPLQDLEAALKELEDHQRKVSKPEIRSKSLPRPPKTRHDYGHRRDFDDHRNLEEDNKELYQMHDLRDVDYENYKERKAKELEDRRPDRDEYCGWRDRDRDRDRDFDPEDDDYDFDAPRPRRMWAERDKRNRGRSEYYDREEYYTEPRGRRARSMYDTGPRWDDEPLDPRRDVESGRNRRLRRLYTVDDSGRPPHRYHSPSPDRDDWSDEVVVPRRSRPSAWGSRQSEIYPVQPETPKEIKPVPIWLCVFLVASYIVAGTFLFKHWENWEYLDAAYFCFITLTTIGFGDFVPAQGQSFKSDNAVDAVHSIALCSLYLLFGIALLAMSFNLVQEEVRARVSALATRLGIIKSKVQEESDSEY